MMMRKQNILLFVLSDKTEFTKHLRHFKNTSKFRTNAIHIPHTTWPGVLWFR
jgi:hypothetical protein